jgi:hypothetical protein
MTRRPLVPLAMMMAVAAAPYAGCSQAGTAVTDGGAGADVLEGGVAEASDARPPVLNEDGWVQIYFGGQDCGLYAAPSREKMPAPVAWEPCAGALPNGLACRQIKADWPAPTRQGAMGPIGPSYSAWDAPSGKLVIDTTRFMGDKTYTLFAEADGEVRTAIVQTRQECFVGTPSVADGVGIVSASWGTQPTRIRVGAFGGKLDELPRMLVSFENTGPRNYYAGRDAFFEYGGGWTLRSWIDGAEITRLTSADPGQLAAPFFRGDGLFFQISNLAYGRIKVYTRTAGLQDLVSYGNDVSRRASDLGSDGLDMVWLEGTGRSSSQQPYSTVEIFTAKYTTAAASLQKRRVRSEAVGDIGLSPFVVGCGFAAHTFLVPAGEQGVRIVRLSDGRSWKLIAAPERQWHRPIALSCAELYVNTFTRDGFNLARIRLDSLGPGEPAD